MKLENEKILERLVPGYKAFYLTINWSSLLRSDLRNNFIDLSLVFDSIKNNLEFIFNYDYLYLINEESISSLNNIINNLGQLVNNIDQTNHQNFSQQRISVMRESINLLQSIQFLKNIIDMMSPDYIKNKNIDDINSKIESLNVKSKEISDNIKVLDTELSKAYFGKYFQDESKSKNISKWVFFSLIVILLVSGLWFLYEEVIPKLQITQVSNLNDLYNWVVHKTGYIGIIFLYAYLLHFFMKEFNYNKTLATEYKHKQLVINHHKKIVDSIKDVDPEKTKDINNSLTLMLAKSMFELKEDKTSEMENILPLAHLSNLLSKK